MAKKSKKIERVEISDVSGNTASETSKKQGSQSKRYCFTLNNYQEDNLELLYSTLGTLGNYLCGKEVGAEGTPHLQGYIELNKRMRITELKKLIVLGKIHWEQCKGSRAENLTYC